MMRREKAAQYFIVAWVKDWDLFTYLGVIADGGPNIPFEQAHRLYPWLPGPHAFIRRLKVRSYLAESNRPLSDALFDAGGQLARLQLASRVEAFVYAGRSMRYANEGRRAYRLETRAMRARLDAEKASVENGRRAGGHHWKVCK